VPTQAECYSCVQNVTADSPVRERVYIGPGWRIAHAFGGTLPGWMVVVPRRHVTALDELTENEAAELGPLLRDLTAALRETVGCAKTYVALFAEAEGFAHVHFHVIPRMPDQDPEFRGPRIFGLLAADPARQVTPKVMDQVAADVAAALSRRH
jgi:diadenosine tetraphosphate (Ap4A) HIT family hydrolase